MQITRKARSGERGAMIVQAAVSMIAFLALTALAVDWGVKLIARGEAQRAADAGALAGAISLAFDNAADPPTTAKTFARAFAQANTVFGQQPAVDLAQNDVQLITCPTPDPVGTCVQVDVYRNFERGNPLPSLFSRVVGVAQQGVKATATAKVLQATRTECMRPWAVVDRWDEFNGAEPDYPGADPDWCGGAEWGGCGAPSTYDRHSDGQGKSPLQEDDLYVPPATDGSSPGTGFRAEGTPNDIGKRFALKVQTNDGITPGWGLALDLPRADTTQLGGDSYRDNILSCSRKTVEINDPAVNPCPTDITNYADAVSWAAKGCLRVEKGTMAGPTSQGVDGIVALDPGAHWDVDPQTGAYGVVGSAFPESPRIVPVALFDVEAYLGQLAAMKGGGQPSVVRLVNMFGFFIEGMGDYDDASGSMKLSNGGKAVIGRLMKVSGMGGGSVTLDNRASFSRIIVLVR